MTPPLRLRPLGEADLEKIADLESGCAGGWSPAQLSSELKRPGGWQLLGYFPEVDKTVGYIFGHTVLDEAEIYRLVVSPPMRGQGYGSRLLALTIDRLRQQGVTALFLEVRESNRAALALYRRAGFSPAGRRKEYYSRPPEDAIVLRRTITS